MNRKIEVVAAVIISQGKVLLASRPEDKPPAGWEFPGGKVEPGESFKHALKRELKEELDLNITPGDEIYRIATPVITLHFIRAFINSKTNPRARENQLWKWVELNGETPEQLLENDLIFWKFITNSF